MPPQYVSEHKLGSVALMFPGQGSQFPGMAKDLISESSKAREILERADDCAGYFLSKIMEGEPPGELDCTRHTQPAIFVHSVALLEEFRSTYSVSPVVVAGHSLGEYSALYAAGVLDFESALRIILVRARGMEEAQPSSTCGMAAIIGMSKERALELVETCRGSDVLEIANFNAPDQMVISGHMKTVHRAVEAVRKEKRTRAVVLNVSSAFHTRLMEPSLEALRGELGQVSFGQAAYPVVANLDAQTYPSVESEIKERLVNQVVHPVLWEDCVKTMMNRGAKTFIEIGPGKVLAGLLRRIEKAATAINVSDLQSLRSLQGTLG
jgi:[acyl-carrier-protein] S-malonyltransferase